MELLLLERRGCAGGGANRGRGGDCHHGDRSVSGHAMHGGCGRGLRRSTGGGDEGGLLVLGAQSGGDDVGLLL